MAETPPCDWHNPSPITWHHWRPDVAEDVQMVLERWPNVTANTYPCHPWEGWSDLSVDFWGSAGRGDSLPLRIGPQIREYLMELMGPPFIRHTIWRHQLWVYSSGWQNWSLNDHSGRLRHLHVTYLP